MPGNILVCGGGAAGMMAAIAAAKHGGKVTLLEKNDKTGRKLKITGKGRCNVTNVAETPQLIANLPGNGQFLYGALNRFSNEDVMAFFEKLGVPLKVERGGRVFPQSDCAGDVVAALNREMQRLKVEVLYGKSGDEILMEDGAVCGITVGKERFYADKVILATGGASYPATGSDGSGYAMAAKAGHAIVPLKPSLVPLVGEEPWLADVSGLSLKNAAVTLWAGDKLLGQDFGEMLFTHFGLSGPVILSLSKAACAWWEKNPKVPLTVKINLKPALDDRQLDARLLRDFAKYSRKQFQNALGDLLPKSLIPVFITRSGIAPGKAVHQISREERSRLLELLQQFPVTVTRPRPLAEAIVTAGGISVREVNPKTMESKLISGLYFAGEVLDIDGYTGGYNLQAAFSSGYVAGVSAAEAAKGELVQ